MYYKAIRTNSVLHSNSDGKSDHERQIIGIGAFEKEASQTYILICKMEKFGSVEEQYQEADRIAQLLNENTKYYTQREAEIQGISQLPLG